ncbi:MAG: 60 kDa SS-A/Ro ribonucleoprotein [Acidobacteriota bacterium]|jgi:60 kDa SS-A/Ro ribonucleoprotein
MANKTLFKSLVGKSIPATNAINEERAPAYALSPKHQLAQYATTGCLNTTFYAAADEQLATVLELCAEVDAEFIAKTAVFCRERGFMKDMPALLTASLSVKDRDLLARVFPRVIDNAKMLRNFVQIMRSGVVGRKSLGSAPKRLVREWLDARDPATLFKSNVGQDPSLADIVKMVHPKPKDAAREALFGYFIGRDYAFDAMPEIVREFELFKKDHSREVPDVPFQMLTALELGTPEWTAIARRAPWQMTRMNLNTFARHGVFRVEGIGKLIAERLRDAKAIAKARVFPYQLLMAYTMANANAEIPREVCDALQGAMEIAIANVPAIEGRVFVCPDVSGSMLSPVTGYHAGATTAVCCVDVAALVAAAVLRKNPQTEVLPFECDVVAVNLNPRDSVMTNAAKLGSIGGGGTNCSAPLAQLNRRGAKGDLVIFVSDYESWVDARGRRGTEMMREWNVFKQRNPDARLVCMDVQPYRTVQAIDREDILNVGGFSDQVFDVISEFARGHMNADHWIGVIDSVTL